MFLLVWGCNFFHFPLIWQKKIIQKRHIIIASIWFKMLSCNEVFLINSLWWTNHLQVCIISATKKITKSIMVLQKKLLLHTNLKKEFFYSEFTVLQSETLLTSRTHSRQLLVLPASLTQSQTMQMSEKRADFIYICINTTEPSQPSKVSLNMSANLFADKEHDSMTEVCKSAPEWNCDICNIVLQRGQIPAATWL